MNDSCNQPRHEDAFRALEQDELSDTARANARHMLLLCAWCHAELETMDSIAHSLKEAGDLAHTRPPVTPAFRAFMHAHMASQQHHGVADTMPAWRSRRGLAVFFWAAAAVLAMAGGISWLNEHRRTASGPDTVLGIRLTPCGLITTRPAFLQVEHFAGVGGAVVQWEIELSTVDRTVFKTTVRDLVQPIAIPADIALDAQVEYLWQVYALDDAGRRLHDARPTLSAAFEIQP